MTISLKHATEAVGVEAGNGEIGKTEWNEEHTLTAGAGKIVGRYSGTDGAVQEITPSTGLTLNSTTGNLTVDFSGYAALAGADFTGPVTVTVNESTTADDMGLQVINSAASATNSGWAIAHEVDGGLRIKKIGDAATKVFHLSSSGTAGFGMDASAGSGVSIDFGSTPFSIFRSGVELVKVLGSNNNGQFVVSGSGGNKFAIGGQTNDFAIYDGAYITNGTRRVLITQAGLMAIGANTPAEKLDVDGTVKGTALKSSSYTIATLPSASGIGAGSIIYCTDETGGAIPLFSDGTNWRRVTDRAVAS